MNLRIPGPTPCPQEVLQAQALPMVNHRGPQFAELMARVTDRLKQVFQTSGDVFVLTCSGTGAMEAIVVNTLSPGDRVLSLTCGFFGERFAELAQAYGADVVRLDFPWGAAVDPQRVRQALRDDPSIQAIQIVHNETSTGVTNPLREVAALAREFDKLLLVDAVSSLGSLKLPVDAWGCDAVATASQKGFMVPPGLGLVSMGPRAWQAHARSRMPRYYLDLGKAKSFLERKQTPWTPAVSTFFALDVALDLMLKEGMHRIAQRHSALASRTRDGVKALGLSLFPEREADASNTVTAVKVPQGVEARQLLQGLRQQGVELAGGQDQLSGKVFRIGHLGYVTEADIDGALLALEKALAAQGYKASAAARRGSSE
ncbi:MAG: alanine--glyoxylate aminotransferase family protein [Chloroflexi bacterium]|nr:alanine--glyoxylate aminotransferase family protein [Chloroflexota bacterium]